jgi:hypothetical protein
LNEGPEAGLGLSCTKDGLFLGATPLLERERGGSFLVRSPDDLERLLASGYGADVVLVRIMPGLRTVASALNDNNLCRARIAAVHLRVPPLPDALARLDMQLEDVSLTLERIAKTTMAGDWDPAKHPRAGTAPNPGWFAPTDGSGDNIEPTLVSDNSDDDGRLHLPPTERNDEIGDLLEWIANAKPEDAEAIKGDIRHQFDDVGDFGDGYALRQALAEVLAHPDAATRQKVLDEYESITHQNPALIGQLFWSMALGMVPGGRGARLVGPAARAAEEAASEFWTLGWAARGVRIHQALGANLVNNFPVIDRFADGIATSIKSLDLNAATYQDTGRLLRRLNNYIDQVASFNGRAWADVDIKSSDILGRELIVAIPKNSGVAAQRAAMKAAIERAKTVGVRLRFEPF